MINLIKANIYRLLHAKVTYVILILAVLFYLLGFGFMKIIYDVYEPGEDEANPRDIVESWKGDGVSVSQFYRQVYPEFKKRYKQWKRNHCWKKSFWELDGFAGDSTISHGGGGGGGGAGGLVMLVLKGIGILVAVWIGWAVIKGVWNGIFGGGGSEEITEAAIMEKWQEHLEKRRDAFDDGLPEKEIEAKGLKNYTWEEWQEKFKKEHEAADKPKTEKKEADCRVFPVM